MYSIQTVSALAFLVLATTSSADSLYSRNSKVLQLTAKTFDEKIKNTYNASIVEFYAPWCGHCKTLKPAFEKAAQNLEGLAQVAAMNCDDDQNKELCAAMGVKGFPTLKTVRQTGTFGKPIISDYNGGRSAGDIVDAVKNLIPNHVTRLQDKEWDSWLQKNNDTAKAILFSDKGTTSALIKSLANDFLGSIQIAQVRDKEANINTVFDITKYPTLLILPGGEAEAVVYNGDLKRRGMLVFLSEYGEVRTVPSKAAKKSRTSSSSKVDKKAFSKASKSHESAEASSSAATGTTVTIDEPGFTESPNPFVETEAIPIPVPTGPEPITSLETQVDLGTKCLGPKTNTCVIVLLPSGDSTDSSTSLASLAMLSQKHNRLGDHLFPFYAVPAINPGAAAVIKALNLEKSNKPQLVALNGKRRWWRHYDNSNGFEASEIESWIDGIRFGDSKKNKLPDDILLDSNTVTSVGPEESTVPHGEL